MRVSTFASLQVLVSSYTWESFKPARLNRAERLSPERTVKLLLTSVGSGFTSAGGSTVKGSVAAVVIGFVRVAGGAGSSVSAAVEASSELGLAILLGGASVSTVRTSPEGAGCEGASKLPEAQTLKTTTSAPAAAMWPLG